MRTLRLFYGVLLTGLLITNYGCTGLQSFSAIGRSGDTVALALSWNQDVDRNDMTVTITDSLGTIFTYLPGDPAVRAVVNSYPDPVSNLIVGVETNQFLIAAEPLYGIFIEGNVTAGDKDYSQKIMFVDLPAGMAIGNATIDVSTPTASIGPIGVVIVDGTGTPHDFNAQELTITDSHLRAMERAEHYTITFSGSAVPHAIQLDFTHDPDVDNGGTGRAYVAKSRGDIKNLSWTDDGTNLRVIIIPAADRAPTDLSEFKFYVAGGITGLVLVPSSVGAFDLNGNTVPGVIASIN